VSDEYATAFACVKPNKLAAGVVYLVFTKHQERENAAKLMEALADPKGYLVKRWEERANLKCDYGISNVVTRQAPAGLFAERFVCMASTGNWAFIERKCNDAENELDSKILSKGAPAKIGDVYRPLYNLCWEVAAKE